jgi:hypothetical protein
VEHVRKMITGGVAVTLAVASAAATGAFAGGNGAARSGLSPTSGSSTNQCQPGSGSGTNGFVILNAPGQPGNAGKLIVSLKRATPNTTYMVQVASNDGNNACMPEGTLTTNGVGNGNAHIADPTLGNGSFYVVLTDSNTNEAFASGPVSVN